MTADTHSTPLEALQAVIEYVVANSQTVTDTEAAHYLVELASLRFYLQRLAAKVAERDGH
jgi:hypothetical protein